MPECFTAPVSDSLDKVDAALSFWAKGATADSFETADWRVHHWQYFLNSLPEVQTQLQLMELDERFKLTESTNAEIACDWFRVAIRNHYDPVLPALSAYLIRIGRGKFVRPLFTELQVAGYDTEMEQIYSQARKGYHPSIVTQLDNILNFS